jgi:hypothetical protein
MKTNWPAYLGVLALVSLAGVTMVASHLVASLAVESLRAAMM